jgi:putative tryptophan/tyrosine transport system substrate-binding protein
MKRRGFILLLGGAAVVRPLTVIAQQPPHRPLIGVLSPITREAAKRNVDAFHGALQTLGYVEGDNIAVEFRFAGGRLEALAALADEWWRSGPISLSSAAMAGFSP